MLDFANQYSLYHTSIECRSRVGLVDEFKILFCPVQSFGLQSIYLASPQNTFPYLRTTPLSFYFMYSRDDFDWVLFNSLFSFSVPMAIIALHMGQFLQGGKNGRLTSYFFLKVEPPCDQTWWDSLVFSILSCFSYVLHAENTLVGPLGPF